jgi:hypothetical protein
MRAFLPAIAALVLAGVPGEAADPPALAFGGGILTLARLPPILGDEAVAKHLQTGLTTVFLFTVECRGAAPQKGAAQVALRYDLWEEVYHVESVPAPTARTAVESTASAQDWWRAAVVTVAPAGGRWLAAPARARVTLQVLPFSQTEQRDAQDWLLRSFRVAGPEAPPGQGAEGSGPPGAERAGSPAPVRDFYGAMLASSIGRRSLITWSWNVAVVAEPR